MFADRDGDSSGRQTCQREGRRIEQAPEPAAANEHPFQQLVGKGGGDGTGGSNRRARIVSLGQPVLYCRPSGGVRPLNYRCKRAADQHVSHLTQAHQWGSRGVRRRPEATGKVQSTFGRAFGCVRQQTQEFDLDLIKAGTFRMGLKTLSGDLDSMAVRVARESPSAALEVRPRSPGEPRWKAFHCKFKYRDGSTSGGTIAFPDGFVVTAERLLMIVSRNRDKKGIENFAVAAAMRGDFKNVQVVNDRKGQPKLVELRSADGSAFIHISFVSEGFPALLSWLDPASVERLDEAAAEQHREEIRIADARRVEAEQQAEQEKIRAAAALFAETQGGSTPRSPISITAGSIFDHRKTFHYQLAARADQCIDAFVRAFESGGGLVLRAKWDIDRSASEATAVYKGRKGVMALGTMISDMATAEQEGALDSEVRFEVVGQDDGQIFCTMWLAEHANRLGFVNDGRFFRPYLRSVQAELSKLDPNLRVIKV